MSRSDLFLSESGGEFKKQKLDDSSLSNYVKLKFVNNQDNEETHFKVHRSTKIGKVFDSYCQFKQLKHQVDFIHDGARVNRSFTVNQLGLEDGDEFFVMSSMNGGAGGGFYA